MRLKHTAALSILAGGVLAASAIAQNTGPSTLQSPYMNAAIPSSGVQFYSVASNGNGVSAPDETFTRLNGAAPYRLVGIPDGMGLLRTPEDIQNGTFTLVCNHEIGATVGVVRDHGSIGSFVSRWTIRSNPGQPNHLEVIGAQDLIQQIKLWNLTTSAYDTYSSASPMPSGLARLCSGDTAAPGAYAFGNLGTDARIHLAGEENGATGRCFAHIITGSEGGVSYELPRLGDYSWENAVACPEPQAKTIIMGLDDSTPGQVYMYVGQKQSTGTTIERAGLSNGTKYGIVVAGVTVNAGVPSEDRVYGLGTAATGPIFTKPFTLASFGDVTTVTGAQLNSMSDAAGVVNWLRPEDGCWDRMDHSKFYFVTTDSFTGNSRLWMLDFTDIAQPELGGVVTMLFDGSVPSTLAGGIVSAGATDMRMMDNMGTTHNNQLLIQEDVGNNARLGRMWLYDLSADRVTEIGVPDANRFITGAPNFLTQDEETSGIIDAWDIIGPGWFMLDMQAHYSIAGELAEGGQIMAVYIPQTIPGPLSCYANCDGSTLAPVLNVNDYQCFLNLFAAGDPRANCDGSITAPILNVNDFACFVNAAAAGCN